MQLADIVCWLDNLPVANDDSSLLMTLASAFPPRLDNLNYAFSNPIDNPANELQPSTDQ